jgi:hypothetical protein
VGLRTIDIGPELTALALVRLAEHGYRPFVATGDGAEGVPERAPHDRVIATCGLHEVPQAWIDQTRHGGKILVNMLGPWNGFAMVLLTVHGDTASGRFQRQWGGFMPRRTDPARAYDYAVRTARNATDPTESHTVLDPQTLDGDTSFGLVAQSVLSGVVSCQIFVDGTKNLATEIITSDGSSWAVAHHEAERDLGHRVLQAGPRRLWDEIEAVHHKWEVHDRPAHDRFGLTVGGGATPVLWLDSPDVSWSS